MIVFYGVLAVVAAGFGLYFIYLADMYYRFPENGHIYLILTFIAFMAINCFLLPNLASSSINRVYETDDGWMIICIVSACATCIIWGIVGFIEVLKGKRRRAKMKRRQ